MNSTMLIIILLVVACAAVVGVLLLDEIRASRNHNNNLDKRWKEYREWADSRSCLGCGKKRADLFRDDTGKVLEMWVTEECCQECWRKGVPLRSTEGEDWRRRFESTC